jgi:chorismate mutase/prephenate dehydratase
MHFSALRKKIDIIDEKILSLLNRRLEIVIQIGKKKLLFQKKIYVPEREKFVLERLEKLNKGPMRSDSIRAVYREIMSAAIALEKPLSIACLGHRGSPAYLAACSKFGHSAKYMPLAKAVDLFRGVERGKYDYAVVPVSTLLEIRTNHLLNTGGKNAVRICAEIDMGPFPVRKRPSSRIQKVGRNIVPALKKTSVASERNIFLVFGKQSPEPTGGDKTSMYYAVGNHPGALCDSLAVFKKYKANLLSIENSLLKRKDKKSFFYVEVKGHIKDKSLSNAVEELKNKSSSLIILGSYPRCASTS